MLPSLPSLWTTHNEGTPPLSKVGGILLAFADTWTDCISDAWEKNVVSRGFRPEYTFTFLLSNEPTSPQKLTDLYDALADLLSLEIIDIVPQVEKFNIFT